MSRPRTPVPQPAPRRATKAHRCSLHRQLIRWFELHARDLPWRRTRDPYAVTVSEFMLQQTRVEAVVAYFLRWMERFPDFASLADATEDDVLRMWQGLGYYSRARNLHRLAQIIHADHDGRLPTCPRALRELPGIGEYSANAIAAFAFNRPAPVVDANIARVLTRWTNSRTPVDTAAGKAGLRQLAGGLQPPATEGTARVWNSAVMELGALICRAGTPLCTQCPVQNLCRAPNPSVLPVKSPAPAITNKLESRALVFRDRKIWLEKSSGPRWPGMFILPQVRLTQLGHGATPLATHTYPITRFQITMRIYQAPPALPLAGLRGFHQSELVAVAMPPPHRRAVAKALACVHSP